MLATFLEYKELMMIYTCAMKEVQTKFEVLSTEFQVRYQRNPIRSMSTRLKKTSAIAGKLAKRDLSFTLKNIEENLHDVAGVRVICSYTSDIYMLADALTRQDDILLIQRKDYIENPKPNGYRSLHLIVGVPIFLRSEKKIMKVEVQFRTISMDFWASLEHKIRYKKNLPFVADLEKELFECAVLSAELENRMERIQKMADCYLNDSGKEKKT
jgi:putative GTP pyrophosphokinase